MHYWDIYGIHGADFLFMYSQHDRKRRHLVLTQDKNQGIGGKKPFI